MRRALFKQVYYFICRPPITSGTCLSFIAVSSARAKSCTNALRSCVTRGSFAYLKRAFSFGHIFLIAHVSSLLIGQTHARGHAALESGRSTTQLLRIHVASPIEPTASRLKFRSSSHFQTARHGGSTFKIQRLNRLCRRLVAPIVRFPKRSDIRRDRSKSANSRSSFLRVAVTNAPAAFRAL